MSETRTEVDLLGPKEVPADVYWGIHTKRAIENFPISGRVVSDYPAFVKGMAHVKKAEALANRQARVISQEVADAITTACDLILDEDVALDQFPVDLFQGGAGTSVNMNANEVIANLALESMGLEKGRYDVINPNDHVNKSQSTNDAYPTGLRLAIYSMVTDLVTEIGELADDEKNAQQELEQDLAEPKAKLEHLNNQRNALRETLPADVVAEYDRLAERQGLPVVLELKEGYLVNAPVSLSAAELGQAAKAPADQLWISGETGYLIARP